MTFKKSEQFENLVFYGNKRYYIEDLSHKDFSLEHTTPYMITLLDTTIEERSWGILLVRVVDLLIQKKTVMEDKLVSFRTSWSEKEIFLLDNKKKNCKELINGMYLDCNHTALHSCWLLGEILGLFGVDKTSVCLLIRRPPQAEPQEVKDNIRGEIKAEFKEYLCCECGKAQDESEQIIRIIDDKINRLLLDESPSYNDFFLFDDYYYVHNFGYKIKKKLGKEIYGNMYKEQIKVIDLLVSFYKKKFNSLGE